jgi:predicted GNAT family acetyltransferase
MCISFYIYPEMEHVLDNPIYNAMISGNRHLSTRTESVRFFPKEISPFVGLKEFDEHSFSVLAGIHPPKGTAVMITAKSPQLPASFKIIHQSVILQMVAENPYPPVEIKDEIVGLKVKDVPQMLELTRMTQPGPFAERTIEFGNYKGIFNAGQLVAMAGYRMHPGQYIEVSAICTHPDHTGKGYGSMLTLYHANQILEQGSIPFLHVRKDNAGAIRLYENSGFVIRSNMYLNVFQMG